MTLCAIWYHLYILKNVKNTHRGVLVVGFALPTSTDFTRKNVNSFALSYHNKPSY